MKNIHKVSIIALSFICNVYISYSSNQINDLTEQSINDYQRSTSKLLSDYKALKIMCENTEELKISAINNGIDLFTNLTKLTITGNSFTKNDAQAVPTTVKYLYIPNVEMTKTVFNALLPKSRKFDELSITVNDETQNFYKQKTQRDRITLLKVKDKIVPKD